MDGLPPDFTTIARTRQRPRAAAIGCVGTGLHTGARIQLEFQPAPVGTGIVFRRTDIGADIPARFDRVADTRLCTLLQDPTVAEARVGTVEHAMAALAACGVDNAVVAVNGPEIPVLDGSASPFVFLIDCAGTVEQDAPTRMIEVLRPIRVSAGEAFAELRPSVAGGFEMAVSIEFDSAAIGRQALTLQMTEGSFRRDLAEARTFTMAADIEGLRAAGLARGGSLQNAIVVEGDRVVNPGGLRMRDEFVRHKMLDIVGDMALAGAPLKARLIAHRPGHTLNNRLLRALFANDSAWTWTDAPSFAGWGAVPFMAAAAPV